MEKIPLIKPVLSNTTKIWTEFSSKKNRYIFFGICIIALFLRLALVSKTPILGDEPTYSIRSIGYIDTLFSSAQTTPVDWFSSLPWWAHFSFHDHPPLAFILNHIFFNLFGYSLIATRLPSIIAGILSTIVVYCIAKKILNEKGGLIAMFLYAVNIMAVFFERVGLLESITNFFILLSFYFFILALEEKKFLLHWAIILGLAMITKYTAFAVLPVYALVLLIYRQNYFKEKRFYFSLLGLFIVFLPVIVFNAGMYISRGHFDLQLSYFLHQKTDEWKVLPGKMAIPDFKGRVIGLGSVVSRTSPFFAALFLASLFICTTVFLKGKNANLPLQVIFLSFFGFLFFTLLAGPEGRFQYYLMPYACILIAFFLVSIMKQWGPKKIGIFVIIFFGYEFFYSLNANVLSAANYSVGTTYILQNYQMALKDFGITNLDNFFDSELSGKYPKYQFYPSNGIIRNKAEKYYKEIKSQNNQPSGAVFILDPRLEIRTFLWVFIKRLMYQGWMAIYVKDAVGGNILKSGLSTETDVTYYYINPGQFTIMNDDLLDDTGDKFSKTLENLGLKPVVISNSLSQPCFYIYKFDNKILEEVLRSF